MSKGITIPNIPRFIFKTVRDNPNYIHLDPKHYHGDLNIDTTVEYEVSGVVTSYITDNNNKVTAIVLSCGRVFQTSIEDVRQVHFDQYPDYINKLATLKRSCFFKDDILSCSICGTRQHDPDTNCENNKCKAIFK